MALTKTLMPVGTSLALVFDKPILDLLEIDRSTPLRLTLENDRIIIEPLRQRGADSRAADVAPPPETPASSAAGATPTIVRGDPTTMGNYAPADLVEPSDRVHLLVERNPKRSGSKSAARFDKYREGMRVAEAYAAGIWPQDVRWDLAHQFIELHRS